jgi:acetyltransferase-like isoleucine patch superfamily enzyme
VKKDHRPYYLKKFHQKFQKWYAQKYIAPQCEYFGRSIVFMKPWHVEIFGAPVSIGDYSTIIASPDKKIRLTVWSLWSGGGKIDIGKYCLVCPGTRIASATEVTIGDNTMLAQGVSITDADWHGVYDRSTPIGITRPVVIGKNVWIGDSAIICKGVTIGENSVVGAGSVVVKDIPANVIAAGNPATVVKYLEPDKPIKTRSDWMADPAKLASDFALIDRALMRGNSLRGWFRSLLFPRFGD